jgi:hypothetical protein
MCPLITVLMILAIIRGIVRMFVLNSNLDKPLPFPAYNPETG